jgi:5-methylcytosine-specific restriction protein A
MMERQPRHYRDRRRKHAIGRFYDPKWDAEAKEFKRHNPYCLGCRAAFNERLPTTVVDHIEPHRGDRTKFADPLNRQPSCEWHHNAIKPMLERQYEQGEIGLAALRLDSVEAIALSRSRRRSTIGADGWAI